MATHPEGMCYKTFFIIPVGLDSHGFFFFFFNWHFSKNESPLFENKTLEHIKTSGKDQITFVGVVTYSLHPGVACILICDSHAGSGLFASILIGRRLRKRGSGSWITATSTNGSFFFFFLNNIHYTN